MTDHPSLFTDDAGKRTGAECGLCGDPVPHSRDYCRECDEEKREPLIEEAREIARSAPYVRGSETSKKAAGAIQASSASLRVQVLAYLLHTGGATDQEVQQALDIRPSTQRPRRVELVEMGLVRDSGRTRETESGREATVWVAVHSNRR